MLRKILKNPKNIHLLIQFYLYAILCATLFLYIQNICTSRGILLDDFVYVGGDYISFFTASEIVDFDQSQIYNFDLQKELRKKEFPELDRILQNELYFIYPPLVANALNILHVHGNYVLSYILFTAFGFFCLIGSLFFMVKKINFFDHNSKSFFLLLILGYPAYLINCIIGGQMSWIATCLYALVFLLIKNRSYFFAGMLFSLSYYKPPLFLISLIVFCCTFEKAFFIGFLFGATILIFSTWYIFGSHVIVDYLAKASTYTYAQDFVAGVSLPPDQGAGLIGFIFSLPVTTQTKLLLILICYILVLGSVYNIGRRVLYKDGNSVDELGYSFVIVSSCLLSIQFIRYDLTILLVPFILLIHKFSYVKSRNMVALLVLIGLFYFEALFRFVTVRGLTFNVSSFLLFILTFLLYKELALQRYAEKNITSK